MSRLKNDLRIIIEIYKSTEIDNEPIWLSKIVDNLSNYTNKSEVSMILDKLYGMDIIEMRYENVDGKMTNCYFIDEDALDFASEVYRVNFGQRGAS